VKRRVVAVIGLGLIGGSVARALTRAGYRVVGCDRGPVRRRALAARAIAQQAATPEEAAARAGLVVLAASPETNRRLLRRLAAASRDAVFTDVGSVKVPIVREAARLRLAGFVGGHPMAGTAGRGFEASRADLFAGRPWIVTATPHTSAAARRAVRAMIRAVGARPVPVAAAAHDRAMAFLSHVPQVVSWALDGAARQDPVARRLLRVAGPAFADMTRLARSPRPLWREILGLNRREVARALAALRRRLRPSA
jgi:prephenate dehydrogenase